MRYIIDTVLLFGLIVSWAWILHSHDIDKRVHRKLATLHQQMNVNRLDVLSHFDEIDVLAIRSKYMRVLVCDPERGYYRMLLGCDEFGEGGDVDGGLP
jgi:hypothetical protein